MLKDLTTEARNPASEAIDRLTALEIVRLMNAEDANVIPAVGREAEVIAQAIDLIADRLRRGGRLIYLGAGTSGRLGVLDAAECPPTFNTPPEQVVGLIAGGSTALTRAVEGAEDHPETAVKDLQNIDLSARDVVVGIATSGRTPYVIGGLEFARSRGAATIGLSCNRDSKLNIAADLMITPVVGPEVISGSTRLKAGTATKLVLNMLTTGAMVRLGKTYGNLMVDLRATNQKLIDRSRRIVATLTDLSEDLAEERLQQCGGDVKTAIVVERCGVSPEEARRRLQSTGGHLRRALELDAATSGERLAAGDLILGVEGGGTKTIALIARRCNDGTETVLGHGTTGPSNMQAVGLETACWNIESAVAAARMRADVAPGPFAAACLALAGADREQDRAAILHWARERQLAEAIRIENDALPLLSAGTPEGWGIALIAGTGSICLGRSRDGRTARTGGWGYLFGDEGSGYALATAGLRAAARAADGRGPQTELLPAFLQRLRLQRPEQLIPTLYRSSSHRAWIASLAEVVLATAAGDPTARSIVDAAAADLAELVAVTTEKLSLSDAELPLALTGGILLNSELLQARLREHLTRRSLGFEPITLVADSAMGTLRLARELMQSTPARCTSAGLPTC